MTRSSYFEPLKRSYRNWLRKKSHVLPTELPSPFFHANDIDSVIGYFSEFANEQIASQSDIPGSVGGTCYLCNQEVDFSIAGPKDGETVSWRETITCPKCGLINRWRSCLHVFEEVCKPTVDDRIYLTESLSPVYQNLASRFPLLKSSEYLPNAEFGEFTEVHGARIRNEDVTNLRFSDASMEIVLCFDVLEHVADYRSALREFYRVLNSGGQLVISVPFSYQHETLLRARLDDEGNVNHLVEPCYHGDPLSDQGVLSFYDFGMELLDDMREAGFQECFVLCSYSRKWGYLNNNVVFVARKLKSSLKKTALVKSLWKSTRYEVRLIAQNAAEFLRRSTQRAKRRVTRMFIPYRPSYTEKIHAEQGLFEGNEEIQELPEIFHYWSNRYLVPAMERFGFVGPEEFFYQYIGSFLKESNNEEINILSISSGECELELKIAKKLHYWQLDNFVIECLDINTGKLQLGKEAVDEAGLGEKFRFTGVDINIWQPYRKYGIVMANQSFHDIQNLEGLFDSVKRSLRSDGLFIISDAIGRNGHMLWPEAMKAAKPFWDELPEAYRHNRILNRQEQQLINRDGLQEGFVAVRTQDILPLLLERFNFKFFFPFGNIIFVFIDRSFGHNFDADADWDRDFIDRVHASDEKALMSGDLKPTSMLAVLTKQQTDMTLRHPALTPRQCVRKASID